MMMQKLLDGYHPLAGTHDELFAPDGSFRPAFTRAASSLSQRTAEEYARSQSLAERALLNQGVTFSVFKDSEGSEKIFPFCLLPRLIAGDDWAQLERGLSQRLRALSHFLDDVYGDQRMMAEGRIPAEYVLGAK